MWGKEKSKFKDKQQADGKNYKSYIYTNIYMYAGIYMGPYKSGRKRPTIPVKTAWTEERNV